MTSLTLGAAAPLALASTGIQHLDASALRALVRRRHTPIPSGGRVAGTEAQGMLYTRGSTLRSTMEYLVRVAGEAESQIVIARLAPEERTIVQSASLTDDVPYSVALSLWRSADLSMRSVNAQWAEQAGADAIRVLGMQLYAGLMQKPSPIQFLSQHISLFQRYYRPGDMKVTEYAPGRAAARLLGFEPGDTLFCRRLSGGWRSVIEIAGGRDPVVEHARCSLEGDMFCEWVIRWT